MSKREEGRGKREEGHHLQMHTENCKLKTANSPKFFCVKMRSSIDGRHISGAERIVERDKIPFVAGELVRRVQSPCDFMNIKIEAAGEIARLPALPVFANVVDSPEDGWRLAEKILRDAGFTRAPEIRALFAETYPMRGAMLLDADSLERLEPDRGRGIRATCMDSIPSPSASRKNHFAEALTLATKVQAAPGIVGEVCVSDDPGYVTGYVATKDGYFRITKLKEPGSPLGGRIFLYRGRKEDVADTIRFLEKTPILVVRETEADGAPPSSRFCELEKELEARDLAGLRRELRVWDAEGKINFASNDYLNLANDRRVAEAAANAAKKQGAGSGASRFVTGTLDIHMKLERHIAAFKGCEDAIVFPTGYMANVGAISALAGKSDVILSDALNHASIIDGCRLSGADIIRYPHLDLDELERRLAECSSYRRRIVVSDGVFSMDGDVLDLPRFLEICRKYDAFSFVDEAHSTGVMGATGHGLAEFCGCAEKPDFSMGTLSKALGSLGGYVAGSRTAIEYVRQMARAFMFTTAPNPAAMAAADAALSIVETEPQLVAALHRNVEIFCEAAGLPLSPSPIIPVVIGDEREALEISKALDGHGFIIPAIRYPTVAQGSARLRVAIGAAHTEDQLVAAAREIRKT